MIFIKLFNEVAKIAKPMYPDYNLATSLDDLFQDIEIDSLDCLLIGIYMAEIYGIDEEEGKKLNPQNMREFHDLIMKHKTKDVVSVEEAIAGVQ